MTYRNVGFCVAFKPSKDQDMPGIYDGVKRFLVQVTEMGLLLIALAVVAGILFGSTLPFVGNVVANLLTLIKSLGESGLVGLIAVGIILWLLSRRSTA